jgi:hypothetical protein
MTQIHYSFINNFVGFVYYATVTISSVILFHDNSMTSPLARIFQNKGIVVPAVERLS